jgi:hypothetical protein
MDMWEAPMQMAPQSFSGEYTTRHDSSGTHFCYRGVSVLTLHPNGDVTLRRVPGRIETSRDLMNAATRQLRLRIEVALQSDHGGVRHELFVLLKQVAIPFPPTSQKITITGHFLRLYGS